MKNVILVMVMMASTVITAILFAKGFCSSLTQIESIAAIASFSIAAFTAGCVGKQLQ